MQDEVVDDIGLTKDEFAMAFEAAAGPDDPVLEESATPPGDVVDTPPDPVVPEPVVEAPPDPVVVAAPPPPEHVVPSPPPEPAPIETISEDFTEEEATLLASVKENFTEVASLLAATERVTIAKLENKFAAKIAELETKLSQSFAPAISVAQTVAHDKFMAAVLGAHADAVDLMPKVEEWVKTQPEFLQESYNAVLDKGTAAQTIKLYDIFKKETGSAQTPPPPEDSAKKEEKQKRLNAQEGVRGRHTVGRAAVDPDDFQGAFEKFAATA